MHRIHCIFQNLCYNKFTNGAIAPGRRVNIMTEEFDLSQEKLDIDMTAQECNIDDDLPVEDKAPQEEGMSRKQKIILVSIGAAVLLSLLGLIIGLLLFSGRSDEDDLILDNVFAAGIELSGMTVEEAVNALHLATDHSITTEPMVVKIYDGTLTLNPEDTKVSLDVEAMAQAAYSYGRSGNHAEDQQIRKNAHKRSYTIPLLPYLNLDLAQIRSAVDSYCTALDSMYAEPVIALIGNRPVYGDPSPQHQSIRITLGTPLRSLDANDLYDQILDAYSMNELLLEYEAPEILWPSKVTAEGLFDQYCTSPRDAVLDSTTYEIIPESYGYGFHVNALQKMLDDARPGETVEIPLSFIQPEILADDIGNSLFRETLSECTSTSKADDNARDTNLQLACNAINGYIVKPGETFSFLKVLGDISKESGYVDAPVCTVNESMMGGGISQTASALYYCVLHADLDVVERHNHDYATDFIELGLDAYVGNSKDLRFRNNTDTPIRIEASVQRHSVSVSLIGSETLSYTVSIRSEITAKQQPITTYQMLLPDNAQGYQEGDVMVKGIEGYQVSVYKEKKDLSGGSLLSSSSVSTNNYKKRDEIIARIGVFPDEEPTQPEEITTTP